MWEKHKKDDAEEQRPGPSKRTEVIVEVPRASESRLKRSVGVEHKHPAKETPPIVGLSARNQMDVEMLPLSMGLPGDVTVEPNVVKSKFTMATEVAKDLNFSSVADRLLDTQVFTTYHEMLAISPGLHGAYVNKLKSKHVADVSNVHSVGGDLWSTEFEELPSSNSAEVRERMARGKPYVAAATARIKGTLNGVPILFNHDSRSEINVMPRRIQEMCGLPIDTSRHAKWNMKMAAAGAVAQMLGICWDCPVQIGGVVLNIPIFVHEAADYDCLLGTPFEIASRMDTMTKDDGSRWHRIFSVDGVKSVQYCGARGDDPRNQMDVFSFEKSDDTCVARFMVDGSEIEISLGENLVASGMVKNNPGELLASGLSVRAQKNIASVNAKYKPVTKKVKPVNISLHPGESLEVTTRENIPIVTYAFPPRLTEERARTLKFGPDLSDNERAEFLSMLRQHDLALAWDDSEIGLLKPHIEGPLHIFTVDHTPWNYKPFPMSYAEKEIAIDLLKKKLESGIMEMGCGPYASRWFLVKKKNGKFRFIQDAQPINAVTIKDSGITPVVEEFSEAFAGYSLYSLCDLYSGYDQFPLHPDSRDLTGMNTPLGLVRQTRMPQGWTNAVARFQAAMCKVLRRHIPDFSMAFIDDIGIKTGRECDETELRPGVRKFIVDHIEKTREILLDIIDAGLMVSGDKCHFGFGEVVIVGHKCNSEGRGMEDAKVEAITSWKPCRNVREVRGFLGVVGFYRQWIEHFSLIAGPLFKLYKKNMGFAWDTEQQSAMNELKAAVCSAPILKAPEYNVPNRPFILWTDACDTGAGSILEQEDSVGR